jgi:LmbE family N-acetylglucosaminyl deacetylase
LPIDLSRRGLLGAAGLVALGSGLPLANWAQSQGKRLKVVVAGGHPDDPETGAGGTMARYSLLHHDVVCLYLTRGEAGIAGKSHDESARIRTAEAESACRILGARPVFAGQIDGATEVNRARYDEFHNLLQGLQPDIVFTHFPIDTHPDHRAVSLLVFDGWQRSKRKFLLYYFEVLTGEQTQNSQPTDYVDITATEPIKRKACFAHESQGPVQMYAYHEKMSRFRGMECRVEHAEAFVSYFLNAHAGSALQGL